MNKILLFILVCFFILFVLIYIWQCHKQYIHSFYNLNITFRLLMLIKLSEKSSLQQFHVPRFPLIPCSYIAVEVKKEPEPPTEAVKQEEREPATKSAAPAPPSKPPPEKRARLQWQPNLSHMMKLEQGSESSCSTKWKNCWWWGLCLFPFQNCQNYLPLCSVVQFTRC